METDRPHLRKIAAVQARLDYDKPNELYYSESNDSFECWYLDSTAVQAGCKRVDKTKTDKMSIEWEKYTWYTVECW